MSEKNEKITVMPKTKGFDITNMTPSSLISEFNVPKFFIDMVSQFIPTNFGIDMPKFDTKKQALSFGVYSTDSTGERKLMLKLQISFAEKPKHKIIFSTDGGKNKLHQITYEYTENTTKSDED